MMAKKRKTKTTTANGITGVHPEPLPAEYLFEWKEEGQGWKGRFYDRLEPERYSEDPWGYMVIEPEGGLHGLWVWRFRWESTEPQSIAVSFDRSSRGLPGSPSAGWITGRHEDLDKATEQCETCLRAMLVERDRKYKEWWDALPDEPAQAS